MKKKVVTVTEDALLHSKDFFERGQKNNLIFALCDLLGARAESIIDRLSVSKGQISHYRQGYTDIPQKKIFEVAGALSEAIDAAQRQLKEFKKSSNSKSKLDQALIKNLESKIEIAEQILASHMPSLEESYKALEKIVRKKT